MNKKKIIILLIVFIFLIMLGIGGYFGYKKYKEEQVKKNTVDIELVEDLKLEFTDKKKKSDFIKSIKGKIYNDDYIDSSKLGKQKIHIDFENQYGYTVEYEFEIEVVDTVEPIIWLSGSYRLPKGSKTKLTDKILCGDNHDSQPKCYIEGDYDVNKVGTYPLVFKAEDSSGNVAEEPFVLTIYQPVTYSGGGSSSYSGVRTDFNDVISEYKTDKTKIGIDVSKWQGDIDFDKLKKAGVEFIIIRLGGTRGTDGEYFIDSKFKRNIEGAKRVGIPVGLYFYSYADSVDDAIRDALWIKEQIKDYDIDLPIAFDWEEWAYYNEFKLSFYELTNMANAFVKILELNGYKGMLYSSKSYLQYIWLKNDLDIWLAHYTKQTNYQGKYKFWQMCDNGKVSGINGNVDIDIMYLD